MEYRVAVTPDPFDEYTEIRVRWGDYAAVELDEVGNLIMKEQSPGEMIPSLLRVPHALVGPLRDALSEVAPPPDDADLREALTIERERVNKIIDSALWGLA